jgi:hypothetical protein
MNPGFNELWPTTVYLGKIEDETLLSRVCDAIFTEVDLTNPPNDFHEYDILRDGSEVFQEFRDKVVWPAFEKYLLNWNIDINDFEERRVRAWLTGSYTGYAMPVHNHSGSPISSVFYLMNEEQQAGGELVLMDPRHNANRGYQEECLKINAIHLNLANLPCFLGSFITILCLLREKSDWQCPLIYFYK